MLRHNSLLFETGYSLLELIVAMAIIGAISVPLGTFIIKGMSSYQFLQAQSDTSTELGSLSARISRVMRGTTGIVDAQPNTLTILAYFSPQDSVVKQIRYFITGNTLSIGVTPPTGSAPNYTYNSSDEVIKTVRIDLSMGSNALFSYYDDAGNELTSGFQVSQVKQIGIYVAADGNTRSVTVPIAVQTRITLRNFKTNL
jgi:prepilin-type N-terminal cleavage/methylation domain-containing protein